MLLRSLALSIALLWVEYLAGNVGNAATEPGLKNSLQQTCEVDRICTPVANETMLRKHKHGYYPTVDIFYMYSENNKYLYMREGHYWTMASVANKFSSHNPLTNRSDVRIHIAVNSDAMLEQARKFGYHAYDLRVFSANHEQFKANIHKTVTSLEYELTIFRWKVYNSIVTDWNKQHSPEEQIKRIICADGDVLMTMSPAKFYHDVMQTFLLNSTIPHLDHNHKPDHGNAHNVTHHHKKDRELDYQLINLAYGVMCLFSPRGLASFDGFIDEWYSGPEEDVIARSNAAGGGKYWSDMMLLERFMFTEITERNNCFEYDRYKNYYEDWKKAPGSQCLLKALQCIPMSNYHAQGILWGLHFVINHQRTVLTKHNHIHTVNKDTLSIYGAQEKYPYCFMVSSLFLLLSLSLNGYFFFIFVR